MIHITVHRPEVYTAYEQRIAELQAKAKKAEQDAYRMSLYADQLLRALDELRQSNFESDCSWHNNDDAAADRSTLAGCFYRSDCDRHCFWWLRRWG